jgi:hypothetical protein
MMDSYTLLTIAIVTAIILLFVGGVLGWLFSNRQRTKRLRKQFGTEYERVVHEIGDKRQAEDELEARHKRVKSLDIRPLSSEEREHFVEAWQSIQARFVDEPVVAVRKANQLITEVMQTRGYPVVDFEQRAADLSVEHADVVKHYRAARAIVDKNGQHEISTEELRQAMVHYRTLFAELVEVEEIQSKEAIPA